MTAQPVLELIPLSMPWVSIDPFLFCVHHLDAYPAGNEAQGVESFQTIGRNMGADFSAKDGWSMYHGSVVPGFPQHPHRGFETVSVVRRGFIDHSDSLGATARYGEGDVQWLTTGSGIMHSEMFPLVSPDGPNTMELFQIWLNLAPDNKMVDPYFDMLWGDAIPTVTFDQGMVTVDVIAGTLAGRVALPAPPDSWASQPGSDVAIWLIRLAPGARWTMPKAMAGTNRMLYCHMGDNVKVAGAAVEVDVGARLVGDLEVDIVNEGGPAEFLLLQGQPIGAPVFQLGPFVMNSPEELQQAFSDYRTTQFGGWPWSSVDPVHDRTEGRFAIHADGRVERRDHQPASPT